MYINKCYEITIFTNFNLQKIIYYFKMFLFIYLINLSYYEINDSLVYYKSITTYKKYLAILLLLLCYIIYL